MKIGSIPAMRRYLPLHQETKRGQIRWEVYVSNRLKLCQRVPCRKDIMRTEYELLWNLSEFPSGDHWCLILTVPTHSRRLLAILILKYSTEMIIVVHSVSYPLRRPQTKRGLRWDFEQCLERPLVRSKIRCLYWILIHFRWNQIVPRLVLRYLLAWGGWMLSNAVSSCPGFDRAFVSYYSIRLRRKPLKRKDSLIKR